jgi:6-phosphogluconolactonase
VSGARGELEILPDPPALAERVAQWITDLTRVRNGDFAVALSGGSTPRLLYRALASNRFAKDFPWPRVQWFWGDERFVPLDDPNSNYHMAWTEMLSRVPVPVSRIHAIPTEGFSVEQSARAYETELKEFYGAERLDPKRQLFDLVLLGLGSDGHTASLFPGSSVLEERERWTAAVTDRTPERITLTYGALENSAHTAFLVSGAEKHAALHGLLKGDQRLPAARLHPGGELRFFVDAAAMS